MRRILGLAAFAGAASAAAQVAPPDAGVLMSYHFWPEQFVQFVGPELPYSMITVEVNPGKKPVVLVTLTGRGDHTRTLYSDNPVVVAAAKAQGFDARETALAWEEADTQTTGSISTLRMTLPGGKPLEWRFVQGSDISEQGSGLTDLSTSPIPILAYREEAAVAGEGTALKVGNVTSVADVWTEISQPPYFVAYRGALSLGAHTLVFQPGKESWTVTSPAALTPGAAWEFAGEGGEHRTLRVTKADGQNYTMDLTDTAYPAIHTTLQATRVGDGWQVNSLRFTPNRDGEKHSMTVAMTQTALDISVGRKKTIASATLAPSPQGVTLTMQSPGWAKGKTMVETSAVTATTEVDAARP